MIANQANRLLRIICLANKGWTTKTGKQIDLVLFLIEQSGKNHQTCALPEITSNTHRHHDHILNIRSSPARAHGKRGIPSQSQFSIAIRKGLLFPLLSPWNDSSYAMIETDKGGGGGRKEEKKVENTKNYKERSSTGTINLRNLPHFASDLQRLEYLLL